MQEGVCRWGLHTDGLRPHDWLSQREAAQVLHDELGIHPETVRPPLPVPDRNLVFVGVGNGRVRLGATQQHQLDRLSDGWQMSPKRRRRHLGWKAPWDRRSRRRRAT